MRIYERTLGGIRAETWARMARMMLGLAALAFAGIYAWVVSQRLTYPYSLEWFEGGVLIHVQRIIEGKPLYVPPSVDFTSFVYSPLYVWLSAALVPVFGFSYVPMRVLSVVGSIACAGAIFEIVRAEIAALDGPDNKRGVFIALVAAALYLAMYRISNAWYDVGRVDSLLIAFLLWAICLQRRVDLQAQGRVWKFFAAGVLFSLAYLTKQSALGPALVLTAYAVFRHRTRAWPLVVGLIIVAGGISLLLNITSGGWFVFYNFRVLGQHPWVRDLFINFWTKDLLGPLPVAIALAVLGGIVRVVTRRDLLFWLCLAASLLSMALLSRVHTGGGLNTLMPAYALLAVLFGVGLGMLLQVADALPVEWRSPAHIGLYALALVQFACLIYTPGTHVPKADAWQANAQLVERIRNAPGEVFMPFHERDILLAGKSAWTNLATINEVLRIDVPENQALRADFTAAFAAHRFALVIVDPGIPLPGLTDYYQLVDEIRYEPATLPVGWFFPTLQIYAPKGS